MKYLLYMGLQDCLSAPYHFIDWVPSSAVLIATEMEMNKTLIYLNVVWEYSCTAHLLFK